MGLPPPADEDRQIELARYHEQLQGGSTQSKLEQSVIEGCVPKDQVSDSSAATMPMGHISAFRYELLTEARTRFAEFLGVDISEVDENRLSRTSLGIEGWARAHVLDADLPGSSRGDSSCCAFGGRRNSGDDPGSSTSGFSSSLYSDNAHNVQVMRLITTLGSNGAGRPAIIKAVTAGHHEDDVERLYSGQSEVKLKAPKYVRQVMIDVGLESALAPVNMLTLAEPEQILISDEAWTDLEFEVALDSGSVVHVCSVDDVPGYRVGESPGSRRGQEF